MFKFYLFLYSAQQCQTHSAVCQAATTEEGTNSLLQTTKGRRGSLPSSGTSGLGQLTTVLFAVTTLRTRTTLPMHSMVCIRKINVVYNTIIGSEKFQSIGKQCTPHYQGQPVPGVDVNLFQVLVLGPV